MFNQYLTSFFVLADTLAIGKIGKTAVFSVYLYKAASLFYISPRVSFLRYLRIGVWGWECRGGARIPIPLEGSQDVRGRLVAA